MTYRKCIERVLLTIRNHKCAKSLRVCVKLPYYNMYLDSCDLLEQLIMKLLDSTVPHIIMINIKTFKFRKTFEISGKKKVVRVLMEGLEVPYPRGPESSLNPKLPHDIVGQ